LTGFFLPVAGDGGEEGLILLKGVNLALPSMGEREKGEKNASVYISV
jgi:hypothetical protein